ncbi:hypothetical protein IAU59_004643 [Kwoniella sp. CBS 9459]
MPPKRKSTIARSKLQPEAEPHKKPRTTQTKPASPKPIAAEEKKPVISLEEFMAHAKDLEVTAVHGVDRDSSISFKANPKKMSTGSYGWTGSTNSQIHVDGHGAVDVSISINVVVKNSKDTKSDK